MIILRGGFGDEALPPGSELASRDEEDYLLDAELLSAQLPQPYRKIDKILGEILDVAWDIIDSHLQETELAKTAFVPRSCGSIELEKGLLRSLVNNESNPVAFIAIDSKLAVFSSSGALLASVNTPSSGGEEEDYFESLQTAAISPSAGVVVGKTSLRGIFLYVWTGQDLQLVKQLAEGTQIDSVFVCADAIALVHAETHTTDIYLINLDQWTTELLRVQFSNEKTVGDSEPFDVSGNAQTTQGRTEGGEDLTTPREEPPSGEAEKTMTSSRLSWEAPTLTLRVKKPIIAQPSQLSPAQFVKLTDSSDVIGSGQNHFLSESHLNQRLGVFRNHFSDYTKLMPQNVVEEIFARELLINGPVVHFVGSSRTHPYKLEKPEKKIAVLLRWENANNIYHYNLLKQTKDIEMKPEQCWPSNGNISASHAAPPFFAFGSDSGVLTVINLAVTLPTLVESWCNQPIKQVTIFPGRDQLACLYENGQLNVVNLLTKQLTKQVTELWTTPPLRLLTIDNLPEFLLIVEAGGESGLFHIEKEKILVRLPGKLDWCVALPSCGQAVAAVRPSSREVLAPREVVTPFTPRQTFCSSATTTATRDLTRTDINPTFAFETCVTLFDWSEIPELQKYWRPVEPTKQPPSLNDVINAYIQRNVSDRAARWARVKATWVSTGRNTPAAVM